MRVTYHVYGIVQGVGFRPFTAVTAERLGITGTVANKGSYVEIIAEGTPQQLAAFADTIRDHPPERATVLSLDSAEYTEDSGKDFSRFSIIESEKEYGRIFVSPDIATCEACKKELFDPQNRRYLHPFINCTQCGPRLTILDTMPYDRERTAMRRFPMCKACSAEYHDPRSRRYDAQPVCCRDCGPEVFVLGTELRGGDAITAVRRAIMEGKIAAVKGIGGFHLCCDAKNETAVSRLRALKRRPMKPFAVMMKDLQTAERECIIKDGQEALLTGWQKPILLLEKRDSMSVSPQIAPDNRTVGVMLPYAPLHMLLFDYPDGIEMTDCMVMTSGNARGAPICRNDEDAKKEIAGFCDLILTHNREILIRADDSVCDWLNGGPYMIRRSRGFAPLPVMLKHAGERQVLAVGGELKNSFCIARHGMLYASPYIGDTEDLRTVNALKESAARLCGLLEAEPEAVICDTHPLYNTVTVAEELAKERCIPLIRVQHHYAHILSCMAENGCTEPVIGISFDGTGYGDDGTVWGGELLICDPHGYQRAGSVRPFMQTGGDLSAKEGWRIAAALLESPEQCAALGICTEQEARVIGNMSRLHVNSVRSTSCGRIFDAVSAITGIRRCSTFEGEASTALMYAAETYCKQNGYSAPALPCSVTESGGFLTLNTTETVKRIAEIMMQHPERRDTLSFSFHAALCDMIVSACIILREQSGIGICALSGGVFQNRLLTAMTEQKLRAAGFRVLLHSLIPPNDGGICIGQAFFGVMNPGAEQSPTVKK
ncbi:MAG: carbamoyltransferase HypF [Oscillospiraceae bacterium]|nr:carbamoyltransferase HypF [Oscillospiraceae bacterium]